MHAVEVHGLHKSYRGKQVLRGIDFEIHEGEVLGLLGRNGAGKSTIVETIAGLRKPDSGSVRVLDLDPVADRREVRTLLGVQLQAHALHSALTVTEMMSMFAAFYPNPADTEELIHAVALSDSRDTRFENLSGGQQQRLSIALALVGRPRVVLLDELSTGLDPEARRKVWKTIDTLRTDGVTVLLVSHLMEEVDRLCDRVVLIDDGVVVADSTPKELIERAGLTDENATLDEAFLSLIGDAR